jgi:type I restriction enzyme S subunit
MKTYDSCKDSGIDWIGGIPEHWEVSRLKFVGESIIGLTYSPEEVTEDESGYLVLRSSNIQSGKLSLDDNVFVKKQINEKLIARKNDILICARNGSVDLVGKNILIDERTAGQTFGAFMTVFRGRSNQFVYWFFNSPFFDAQKGAFSTSTINQLTSNILNNLITTIPPLSEQTAIANYLDTKTTEIDQVVADKEALINLYEQEKKALINEAVTKGVTLSGVETQNSSPFGGGREGAFKPSGIDWLGEVPEHWEVKKLKYVMQSMNTQRIPLSSEERGGMIERVYDYYGASGIIDQVEDYIFDEPLLLIGEDGANLLSRNSRLVFIAKGKYWVNNHAHILKEKYGVLEYYCELLEQYDFTVWVTGSAQPKLTSENLMNIEVIVPPILEQTAIVHHIETETTKINDKISQIKQEIELLKEYRQALIFEAVTGKICVH